jgi:hypothetical protein
MCCFSGKVEQVTNTRIFARLDDQGNQMLIYQMALRAAQEVAMVLPIPVRAGTGEAAVKFFSFEKYPQVFADLDAMFPAPQARRGGGIPISADSGLAVHSVGAYDASFVPSIADFTRLDERFRLPNQVWEKLPGYRDFGFAVFKLKEGDFEAHPMAFTFPTGRPNQLFFPTLHIHDGKVHEYEEFSHTLYCQATKQNLARWVESPLPVRKDVKWELTSGIILPAQHVHRQTVYGRHPNGDFVAKPRLA